MARSRTRYAGSALFTDMKAMGSALLESRKIAGAERLSGLAEAAQTLSGSLEDTPILQQYADQAAEGLDSLANYVENTEIEDILEDAIEMAKMQPILTLTLAIAGGAIMTQMLRQWRAGSPVKRRRVAAPKKKSVKKAKRRSS